MVVMTPSDENECRQMLHTAFQLDQPAAVRYPRGAGPGAVIEAQMEALPLGRGEIRRQGQRVAFLAFGSMLRPCLDAAEGLDATVANMRFLKPLDGPLALQLADSHDLLVTVEENVVEGGAGSAVAEYLAGQGRAVALLHLGLPDRFVEHGDPALLLKQCGLDADGILAAVRGRLPE
jgi:1-deoxy-D-xylulose-5-phosphate synthase